MGEFLRRVGSKAALALGGLLAALIFIEVGLRLLAPQLTFSAAQAATGAYYRASEWLPFELRPNYHGTHESWDSPDITYTVRTNALGFRDEAFAVKKPASTYRILALGDSFTFGYSVDNGEDYPAQLEAHLNAGGGDVAYEVLNAGFADARSPDSYYVFLRELAPPYTPDLVTVGFFVGNDITDLLYTEWVGEQGGLPVRVTMPRNYVDEFGRFRELPREALPFRYRIPVLRELHSFQFAVERLGLESLAAQHSPDAGEVPPEPDFDYAELLADAFGPTMQGAFDRSMRMLEAMHRLCRERGARFLVLLIPVGYQVDAGWWREGFGTMPYPEHPDAMNPQRAIRAYLEAHDIAYLDLLPVFWGKGRDYYFFPPGHWTAGGNRLAAEAIGEHLMELLVE